MPSPHPQPQTPPSSPLDLTDQKTRATAWFQELQAAICARFEALEEALCTGPHTALAAGRFEKTSWGRNANKRPPVWNEHKDPHDQNAQEGPYEDGGGGTMALMHGRVFEKVGVNISTVYGTFSDEFRARVDNSSDGRFWAAGLSLVAHLRSPLVPAIHMNTRMVATSTKTWFGGGTDLTPMIENAADTQAFHTALEGMCARHDATYYPRFKEWCDRYFYLPHREEARGVGGIFFDSLNTGDWEKDFAFTQDVGRCFLHIYPQLVATHMHDPWTDAQREAQLIKRGRYVEFNLLYDRGTTFGLKTGGNVNAILMSLPPEAKWP